MRKKHARELTVKIHTLRQERSHHRHDRRGRERRAALLANVGGGGLPPISNYGEAVCLNPTGPQQ
jgi:hypothetical protein